MKPLVLVAVAALSGCAVGPDFQIPAAPDTQTYTREAQPTATVAANGAAGASQAFNAARHATAMWWTQFQSDALNRVVEQALRQSPTLAQARAKLVEARENYNAQFGASEFPSVDANLSGVRQQIDIAQFGIPNVRNPGPFTLFTVVVMGIALRFYRRTLD
jgi:outer membrane protein TolC